MTKKNNMAAVTTDHSLSSLVGKKIKNITMQELDMNGDGADVCQFYTISCTDGERFVLACDGGGRGNQYATATLMDVDEFSDLLEERECEQSISDPDEEESDDEEENMFDNDDKLFDDHEDLDEDI